MFFFFLRVSSINVSVHFLTHSLIQNKKKKKITKEKEKQAHSTPLKLGLTKCMTVQTYIHVSNNLQTLVYTSAPLFTIVFEYISVS